MEHRAVGVDPAGTTIRVALLVDGDNIPADRAGWLLTCAGRLGRVVVRRVYLDTHHLKNWEGSAGFGLCVARTGRGAADLMLATDAVDLFHCGDLGAVAIASSDGGFAPLARFLVERGLVVLGLGSAEAPEDWRRSCTRYEALPRRTPAALLPAKVPDLATSGHADGRTLEEMVAVLLREAGPNGLRLSGLGQRMRDQGVTRAELDAPTWQAWVAARPHLFRPSGAGADLTVRLDLRAGPSGASTRAQPVSDLGAPPQTTPNSASAMESLGGSSSSPWR